MISPLTITRYGPTHRLIPSMLVIPIVESFIALDARYGSLGYAEARPSDDVLEQLPAPHAVHRRNIRVCRGGQTLQGEKCATSRLYQTSNARWYFGKRQSRQTVPLLGLLCRFICHCQLVQWSIHHPSSFSRFRAFFNPGCGRDLSLFDLLRILINWFLMRVLQSHGLDFRF